LHVCDNFIRSPIQFNPIYLNQATRPIQTHTTQYNNSRSKTCVRLLGNRRCCMFTNQ